MEMILIYKLTKELLQNGYFPFAAAIYTSDPAYTLL